MTYKYNEIVSAKALSDLRESVGWNRMESEYKNPLMTSYYHIAAYAENELIGYVDCVSNGVTDAYVQDLMVHPNYQGKGIGTQILTKVIEEHKHNDIYLRYFKQNPVVKLYERLGFVICEEQPYHFKMVLKAKEYIRQGDIFQVVLSNRIEAEIEGSLFDTYRVG